MNENESFFGEPVFNESYLNKLREQDPATEEHFISYFSDRLRKTLRARGLLQHDIESVRQETFLRVWGAVRSRTLHHPEGFGSYIHAVCQQVLEEARDARPQLDPPQPDEEKNPLGEESGLEEELQKFQNGALVREVLEMLPRRDRAILRARFFEERDSEEVCVQFGIDRDYLRVLMHRAVQRFGEIYRKKAN